MAKITLMYIDTDVLLTFDRVTTDEEAYKLERRLLKRGWHAQQHSHTLYQYSEYPIEIFVDYSE